MPEITSRLSTALADRYKIDRRLGAGGMATVYLAEDLKHKRKVAVKVLKPDLAAVLGAERFVQEITTTASLQHPNILPLFDSGTAGETDGGTPFLYYVMPYIEGETLRDKLDRETQLSIEEAVRIASDVADALDYAHRNGVIHRDIKPENILLHDGRPMVADFGIALAVSAAAGGRMTETGLSLGTPHYMSPEQATAEKDLSARSDVYSLGSVLYEMLTGSPPHVGASAQQIIMKIVTEEAAPVTSLRKSVPPNVAAAVAKSLEKLPADRFDSAKAFADGLSDPLFAGQGGSRATVVAATTDSGTSQRRWHTALALGAVLLVVAAIGWLRPAPTLETSRQRVVLWRYSLDRLLDPGIAFTGNQAAIAPDGSSIVYTESSGGVFHLMRKLRNESEATPMAGTDGALSPFFSPDGRWIGYRTNDDKLRKVPVDGGGSITLAEDTDLFYGAAAWMDDGTIVYSGIGSSLNRVNEAGGTSSPVGRADTSRSPLTVLTISPLPGSGDFLYTACPGNCAIESDIYVFDSRADSGRSVVANAAGAWYSTTGHLLYTDRAGGLYAVGFDLGRLEVTTGPVPVIDNVVPGGFAMSASGTILYSTGGSAQYELVWVSRDGSAVSLDSTWLGDFNYPALSPDGRALAVSVFDGTTQLWVRRSDGTRQKLTQEGSVNWRPAWTPDGRSVAFSTNRRGGTQDDFDLYVIPVDVSAPAELLLHHTFGIWEGEFSRDGTWLVARSDEEDGVSNIRGRRLDGDTALVPLLVDKGGTSQIALSPDGNWIAYIGLATGQAEVYVAPFPDITAIRLVSRDGGIEPRWAHSGRELFYKSGDRLMVVEVTPGATLTLGSPRELFSVAEYRSARNRQQYDVTPDDQTFVMIRELAGSTDDVVYVENWFPELLAKVGN
jgi:eukaryotic-like serine/threonine-protein kinase